MTQSPSRNSALRAPTEHGRPHTPRANTPTADRPTLNESPGRQVAR